jgi:hypothetical protein
MKVVDFSLEQGNQYFGRIDGKRFLIGTRVPYQGLKGLRNLSGTAAQRYDAADFRAAHGFWADFLQPTAAAEGALFHTLNTYDRARFTFAFLQFAAHVPNGDFVRYLRALLVLPLASAYFPDLELVSGRICRVRDASAAPVPLESDTSTEGLMDYLNPSAAEVEDTEVIQAAKFVHWAQNDPEHRRVQIECGVAIFQQAMVSYARRYRLDGVDDAVCLVVADIRHQGRAGSAAIVVALASPEPLEALLQIGEREYRPRLLTLRSEIKKSVARGILGTRKYSLAKRDFVPK